MDGAGRLSSCGRRGRCGPKSGSRIRARGRLGPKGDDTKGSAMAFLETVQGMLKTTPEDVEADPNRAAQAIRELQAAVLAIAGQVGGPEQDEGQWIGHN